MKGLKGVRDDATHPHRVPTVTPLGWVSNRRRRMVSVDLSDSLRLKTFERQFSQARIAHAKWAVKRYAKMAKQNGLAIRNYDDRTLTQIMASYAVRPEVREYAVLKLKIEFMDVER